MALFAKKAKPPRGREPSDAGLIEAPSPPMHAEHRNKLSRFISGLDQKDARDRYNVETEDNRISSPSSAVPSFSALEKKVIHWEDGDVANPYNWSSKKKTAIVLVGMLVVVNSTMGSSLPSNAIPFISKHFGITSSTAEILPISIYLVGYVVGPLLFGPLSEAYGRQAIMISTFLGFTVFTMGCALSPTWSSLLVFRFLTGVNASSPISVVSAIYADVYDNPVARGRAVAVFTGGACVGPLIAPIISGFVAPSLDWRWTFWIGLIFAGATVVGRRKHVFHLLRSPGVSGLMFLPIGGGSIIAIGIFLYYDSILRKAQAANKPWTKKEEYRRLPLACLGGPLYVISLFWLGWTARESIPFWVPMLAGFPFGMGFILIFMALLNYLTDAYEIFAASAMAASSCSRSLAGAVLPFAATPLYKNLGVASASSLLAFLSLGMCIIPFVFLWKGDVIRERSTFCRFLKERKEKEVEELAREREERERRQGVADEKDLDEKV